MINAQMKPYDLYVNEPIEDSYGHLNDNWVYVNRIMAAVNFLSADKMSDDIRYKDCRYTGLTKCKGLNIGKEYKLIPVGQDKAYLIKSINEITRLAQYLLQEVL